MLTQENEYLNRAYERLQEISADEQKRLEYEAREKAIRDHEWLMRKSQEFGFNQGYKDGFSKGEAAGFSKGESTGFSKGEAAGFSVRLITLIRKKIQKQKPLGQIADELEETDEAIKPFYDLLQEHGEKTDAEIYDLYQRNTGRNNKQTVFV